MKSRLLDSRVIVVTGGAGRVGQIFVKAINENGGIAIIADTDLEAAKLIELECNGRAEAVSMDITSQASISVVIKYLKDKYSRIDAVINNAYPRSKNYGRKLEDVAYLDFCENVNMHLGGYFLVAQNFCLMFRDQGYGNLINISSIYGSKAPSFDIYQGTGMTMPVEYAAIKSAIEGLTRYFAQYFKGEGIRVNTLSPGGILANQAEKFLLAYGKKCASKGMLDPRDLEGAIVFLLSDGSKFMTGQNLIVDDGFTL